MLPPTVYLQYPQGEVTTAVPMEFELRKLPDGTIDLGFFTSMTTAELKVRKGLLQYECSLPSSTSCLGTSFTE